MIRNTVLVLAPLMGMVGYIWGYHQGITAQEYTVDPMAIKYALIQAMN